MPNKATPTITLGLLLSSLLALPGATATHDPNDFFSPEATFTGVSWQDIHGTSSTNVIAVGSTGSAVSASAIRTGGVWTMLTTPNIGTLTSVWVQSTTLAYATSGTQILRWDGVTWTVVEFPTGQVSLSVWGKSPTNIGFGTTTGTGSASLVAYDGTTFSAPQSCGQQVLAVTSLFASSTTAYYGSYLSPGGATGGHVRSVELGGSLPCSAGAAPSPTGLADLWGAPTDNTINGYWFVGGAGSIYQGQVVGGTDTLVPVMSPVQVNLDAIWGVSPTDIWAVGGANVIHYNGADWTLEPSVGGIGVFTGVYFSSATDGWVVQTSGTIYKLDVNPNLALPVLTGLQWDPSDLVTDASQAQCNGDEVELQINIEPSIGAGGWNAWVIDSDTGVVVEMFTGAAFFNINNKHLHTSRFYPPGDYTIVVTADIVGLLAPDNWAAAPFNVPGGTCRDTADQDLIPFLVHQFNQTNSYINETNQTVIVAIEVFVDSFTANLEAFLWLATVAIAFAFTRAQDGSGAFPAILLFLASIFLGVSAFEGNAALSIIAIGVGLLGLFLGTRRQSQSTG